MDLKLYRQRDADLQGEIDKATSERAAIGTAVLEREADQRSMTDEERARFLALGKSIDKLKAQKAENDDLLKAAEAELESQRRAVARQVAVPHVEVIEKAKPGDWGRDLIAIRKAAIHEVLASDDIARLNRMRAAITGAGESVPSEGGFLVESQRAGGVLQRAYETGAILSRVNRQPIGAGFNGLSIPAIDETSRADDSRCGGIVSDWIGEGGQPGSGMPKFRKIDLKLRKVGAFVYSTDELLVDAVAFEAWVNRNLPLELQFRVEDAIVNGDGANKPQGLLNSPAKISITRGTASHVYLSDVQGMWARMWAPLRRQAVWLVDQSVESELENMSLEIGTGGVLAPIYKPAGSVPGQEFATIYGRPVIPVEYCKALGTSGDIVLANLGEYILIDKGGVDQAVSMHVSFLTDQACYRFIYRVDGQCTWKAALTPKSAGSSLTCVLVLS